MYRQPLSPNDVGIIIGNPFRRGYPLLSLGILYGQVCGGAPSLHYIARGCIIVDMSKYKDLKAKRNVVYRCLFHVVWCPKYRRKVLVDGVSERLSEILHQVAKELEAELLEIEIMPDYVHILCEVDPQFGIHRLVKRLKGRSSRLLRQEFSSLRSRLPTLWTNSYFVATVGGAPLSIIKQYIENQKGV